MPTEPDPMLDLIRDLAEDPTVKPSYRVRARACLKALREAEEAAAVMLRKANLGRAAEAALGEPVGDYLEAGDRLVDDAKRTVAGKGKLPHGLR